MISREMALNGLKGLRIIMPKSLKNTNYEGMGENDAKEFEDTMDIAIDAIEKLAKIEKVMATWLKQAPTTGDVETLRNIQSIVMGEGHMKDYECCRCGLIFQDDMGPGKKEILCPDCGSGAKVVEDLIKPQPSKSILTVTVKISDTELWNQILTIMSDMLGDHRINAEVRKEYEERIKQVQGCN